MSETRAPDLWSEVRRTLQRGQDMYIDREIDACGYEEFSARLDHAAREIADRIEAQIIAPLRAELGTDTARLDALAWLLHVKGEDCTLLGTSRGHVILSTETWPHLGAADIRGALDLIVGVRDAKVRT